MLENSILLKECRICLQTDENETMIQPCRCSGSMKFVHRDCLNTWRKTVDMWRVQNKRLTHCEICHFEYKFENDDIEKINPDCCLIVLDFLKYLVVLNTGSFLCGIIICYIFNTQMRFIEHNDYFKIYIVGFCIVHVILGSIICLYELCKMNDGDVCFCCYIGGEIELECLMCLIIFCVFIVVFKIYYNVINNSKLRQIRARDNRRILDLRSEPIV